MNSFLLTITAFLILAFGALYIAPNYIEWNKYRHVFEDQASRVIGREVKVEGNVKLKFLPAPYLEFQKVTILDNIRETQRTRLNRVKPLFAKIDSFKLWLAIPPLLRGEIKVKKLELGGPHIYVRFDKDGRANWRDLGKTRGIKSKYIPSNVSFDSVNISQGRVSVYQSGQKSPLYLDRIFGQLSAESLTGPYKFDGKFRYEGDVRKLVFSTDKQNDLGILRVKSLLKVVSTGSQYVTEGELHGFSSVPSFKGKLEGQLPVNLLSMLENRPKTYRANFDSEDEASSDNVLSIRSNISATLKRVDLKDLVVSVEDGKRPQSINGLAVLEWNNGFNLKARLKATWLDLDRMLGVKSSKGRRESDRLDEDSVKSAFNLFTSTLNTLGNFVSRAAVHAEIADARLGGSQLGNFELHLVKNRDRYRIAKLAMLLPGRNKLDLSGDLTPTKEHVSFSGNVQIKGISLGALSHWATSKDRKKTVFATNPYSLTGNVIYTPSGFEISQLRGQLNGARISGLFKYKEAKRREFVLELDSDKVDLSDIVSNDTTLKSMLFSLFGGKKNNQVTLNDQEGQTDTLSNLRGRVKLRIGRIRLPDLNGRDFEIQGQLGGGTFVLKSFRMVAEDDLRIRGSGQIKNLNSSAEGHLNIRVAANTAQGLQSLAKQIELPKQIRNNERLLKDLSPLRLSVSLNMHSGGAPTTQITVGGSVADSQLNLTARHEGSINTFGDNRLTLNGTLINPNSSALINQLIRSRNVVSKGETGQGVFRLSVNGIPNASLKTNASLSAGSTQAKFEGSVKFQQGVGSGRGQVTVRSSNAAAGLSLIGLSNTESFSGENLKLSAGLSKNGSTYRIADIRGRIGSMTVQADTEIDTNAKPMRIDFDGRVSRASLPGIMSYLTPNSLPSGLQKIVKVTGAKLDRTWSNSPFNTNNFESLQGSINLQFDAMKLTQNTVLQNGQLRATLKRGRLSFTRFRGQLFNGPFSATGSMSASDGAVALQANLKMSEADIAQLFKDKKNRPLARGEASINLQFAGRGLSPLGLVSGLKGNGQINVRSGEIFNFSPQVLSQMISSSGDKADNKTLVQNFWKSLKGSPFPVRNVRAQVSMQSGMLSIKNISFAAGSTRAQVTTYLELPTMKLDSEWLLSSGADLSGVKLVFAGPLSRITTIPPSVDIGQLQRQLTERKFEKNLETFNKLNANDPETIRRLRQKALNQGNNPAQRITTIPVKTRQQGQNKRNISVGNIGATPQKKNNSDNGQLPSLTNTGSLKKNNQDVGVKYSYEKKNINIPTTRAQTNSEMTQDELIEAVRKQLEEKKRRERERERKKKRNVFENAFPGESGG